MPIVKLLDSYKVYSIIKVDPCGEVSWNFGFSGVFHVFSVQKTTITAHSAAIRNRNPPSPPSLCHFYSATHFSVLSIRPSVHPSIHFSLFSSPLSPSLHPSVGLLLHFTFFPRVFFFISILIFNLILFFCLSVCVFLFVRSPSHPTRPQPFQRFLTFKKKEKEKTEMKSLPSLLPEKI